VDKTFKSLAHAFAEANRVISTGQLNPSQGLHPQPIKQVVFLHPSGKAHLGVGFPLRCFQRLSLPCLATQHCPWQDNWYTSGTSNPVLSY